MLKLGERVSTPVSLQLSRLANYIYITDCCDGINADRLRIDIISYAAARSRIAPELIRGKFTCRFRFDGFVAHRLFEIEGEEGWVLLSLGTYHQHITGQIRCVQHVGR